MVRDRGTSSRRVLPCGVRGYTIAIDLSAVRGVTRAEAGSDAVSLAELLGLVEEDDSAGHVVEIDAPGGRLALRVDRVFAVANVPDDAVRPMPRAVGDTAFSTVLRLGDRLVPLLDPAALVGGSSDLAAPARRWSRQRPAGRGRAERLLILPLTEGGPEDRPWAAALPGGHAEEVVDAEGIVPLLGVTGDIRGIRAWRDGVIAVFDLPARLGLPPLGDGPEGRVAVVFPPGFDEPIGLLVRRGVRMSKLPLAHLRSDRPFPGDPDAFAAAVETEAATLGLLDPSTLLGFASGRAEWRGSAALR